MAEHPLEPIFHPRTIAIVGLSSSADGRAPSFLTALLDQGFDRTRIYPVNPKASDIRGLPCFPSLLDCPGPVDHVISVIPREGAPQLLAQCVEKRVRSVHFFTAGFSETGDAEMAATEREMAATARAAGIRMLGPNCMVMYVPADHISWTSNVPRESGNVFALSQSGVNAGAIISGLGDRGVRLSKCISFGNAADIAAPELFDYAAADESTAIVVGYLESVRDGRSLFEAIKRCARAKPTVILKGGITAAGARAAQSHTGSLAGSLDVFDAMCRQAGALRVDTMEELLDMVVTLTTDARRIQGRRTILMGIGGFSVLSADALAREGLELPELPRSTQDALEEFLPASGNSTRNPIDATFPAGPRQRAIDASLRIAARAEGFDLLIAAAEGFDAPPQRPPNTEPTNGTPAGPQPDHPGSASAAPSAQPAPLGAGAVAQIELLHELQRSSMPILNIRRSRERDGFAAEAYRNGIAVFPSIPRAARSVTSLLQWRERRDGLQQLF